MRLPIVDQYRKPFIEPLGYLTMYAAKADLELIYLVNAACRRGEAPEVVAHQLRNWTKKAKEYAVATLDQIGDRDLRAKALALVNDYEKLRDRRHRAVHDAVEVGIYGSPEEGYEAKPLRVGFVREEGATKQNVAGVTPEDVATLACAFEDLAKDMEAVNYLLAE